MSDQVHILHVVGARPNFMKAAPVLRALAGRDGIRQTLVHTGQHYDVNMSDVFFQQLDMPAPDINLEVGSGSHAQQTAEVMTRFEPVVMQAQPDIVLVYGDINSTVAAALVCAKLSIRVGHVEAGLRSFDRSMPEEINRLVTDQLADLLFTPSADANANLEREGIAPEKVHLVGNAMIDTVIRLLPTAEARMPGLRSTLALEPEQRYALATFHRPSNVDAPEVFQSIVTVLHELAEELPIIFPIHPRTRQRLNNLAFPMTSSNLRLVDPIGYLDFLALQRHATVVFTDSGGIQEETTFLNVPCLTVRENTERPVTITMGTNVLVGQDMQRLRLEARRILSGSALPSAEIPPLWDGATGERIADIVTMRQS